MQRFYKIVFFLIAFIFVTSAFAVNRTCIPIKIADVSTEVIKINEKSSRVLLKAKIASQELSHIDYTFNYGLSWVGPEQVSTKLATMSFTGEQSLTFQVDQFVPGTWYIYQFSYVDHCDGKKHVSDAVNFTPK